MINRHIGSTFESWLDEVGMREEVTVAAVKNVIALRSRRNAHPFPAGIDFSSGHAFRPWRPRRKPARSQ
jgi:hypothetical protein